MVRNSTTYDLTGTDVIAHITRDDLDGTFTGEGRVPYLRWQSMAAARSAALLKASIDLLENRLAAHTITYMDVPKPTLADLLEKHFGAVFTAPQREDINGFAQPDPYADARSEQHPLDDEGRCLNIMCQDNLEEEWAENDERLVETETENAPQDIDARCRYGCCITREGGEAHEEGEDLDTETEDDEATYQPYGENLPDFGSITSVLEWLASQPGVSVYRDDDGRVSTLTGNDSEEG